MELVEGSFVTLSSKLKHVTQVPASRSTLHYTTLHYIVVSSFKFQQYCMAKNDKRLSCRASGEHHHTVALGQGDKKKSVTESREYNAENVKIHRIGVERVK